MDQQRYKYPRTFHMPSSLGRSSDDKVLDNLDHFIGQEVVITEKMDGESTTLYSDYMHARSIDGRHHPSRNWIKAFHRTFSHNIPAGWRICGENLYASHSIAYDDLQSYFYVFSVWENDFCCDWDQTELVCSRYNLANVPLLYRGLFDEDVVTSLAQDMDMTKHEGFVIRLADGFLYNDFDKSVAKYVRPNHVKTEDHWMNQSIVPNKLIGT